jgi:hypothetical protein
MFTNESPFEKINDILKKNPQMSSENQLQINVWTGFCCLIKISKVEKNLKSCKDLKHLVKERRGNSEPGRGKIRAVGC